MSPTVAKLCHKGHENRPCRRTIRPRSRDPIGFADGYTLYRAYFVPGAMDPLGLKCKYVAPDKKNGGWSSAYTVLVPEVHSGGRFQAFKVKCKNGMSHLAVYFCTNCDCGDENETAFYMRVETQHEREFTVAIPAGVRAIPTPVPPDNKITWLIHPDDIGLANRACAEKAKNFPLGKPPTKFPDIPCPKTLPTF